MSDCRNIEKDLSALIDGEFPGERQAEVSAHVEHCPQCAQRVAELRQLVTGIAALPVAQLPPQFLADVRRKLRQEKPSWVDTLFRPVWWKVPLEAMAVVLVGAGIFALVQSEPPRPPVVAMAKNSGMTARILQNEAADKADSEKQTGQALALQPNAVVPTIPTTGQPQVVANTVGAPPALPEMIEIRGDSLVAVRLRVENLAKQLDGRVESVALTNEFLVYLPQSKVAAFRSQVTGSRKPVSYAAPSQADPVVGVKVRVKP